jgi:hypothetical protein
LKRAVKIPEPTVARHAAAAKLSAPAGAAAAGAAAQRVDGRLSEKKYSSGAPIQAGFQNSGAFGFR